MKKRIIALILSAVMLTVCQVFVFTSSAEDRIVVNDYEAKVSGSFVQSWFAYSWNDKRWDKEMQAYNEAGIEYLILGDVASQNAQGGWSYFYPSTVSELDGGTYNGDVITKALESAKKYGVKVFLGMGEYNKWWSNGADKTFVDFSKTSAKIATDIYTQYYNKYSDNIAGLYFSPELFNGASIMSETASNYLIEGMNNILDVVNGFEAKLPVMLSPFYNQSSYYYSLEKTEEFYKKFFTQAHFREYDIFSPQDSVGAGGTKLNFVENVYKMYKSAIDYSTQQGKPIKFWSNCEDFMQTKQSGDVEAFHTADLNKFVEQMKIASKYCERIITFAYSHYYSPNNINPAWHNAYVKYAKTGELSTDKPSDIELLSVKNSGYTFELQWTPSTSSSAISRYAIRYNGDLMDNVVARRYDGGGAIDKIVTKYTIRNQDFPEGDEAFPITVTPYDIYGNAGNSISFTITKDKLSNDVIIENDSDYVPVQMTEEYLPWYDFDFWTDGDNTIGTSRDKYKYFLEYINSATYTVSAVKTGALAGNAMKITSKSGGSFEGIAINTANSATPEYDSSFADSKYFTFYVDTTNRNEAVRIWTIICDNETVDGTTTMTSFAPIAGSTSYMELDGKLVEIENSDQSLTVPADYKGRIFIPLNKETLQPIWGSEDRDGKINLTSLPVLRISFDNIGSRGSSLIIDEIGFMRDYSKAPVYTIGDVDGNDTLNTLDSLLILKNLIGLKKFNSSSMAAADYNADGIVNSLDALDILKTLTGLNKQ